MRSLGRQLGRYVRAFSRNQRGATVILFAITLPLLIAFVGGAIDYGLLLQQRSKLQNTSDAAVIAAARELTVATTDTNHLEAVVRSVVAAHMGDSASTVSISTRSTDDPLSVEVKLSQDSQGIFLKSFAQTEIAARSVALVSGGTPLCVLSLGKVLSAAISLEASARLTGHGCAVYANSRMPNGITSQNSARLQASLICSVGGIVGGTENYDPRPLTDCPPVPDPLADRPPPPVGPCTATNLKIGVPQSYEPTTSGTAGLVNETATESALTRDLEQQGRPRDHFKERFVTLSPGVYCGGLIIGGAASVRLEPGIYVMKDGPLHITDYASIDGEFVGIYFKGTQSTLYFGANTTVSLIAPKDGPLAGLLLYQDRNATPLQTFSILSDNARVLEGTLYLPQAYLFIDADNPIADQSAYTAIITLRMALYAGPHVVLNTDYDQTEVPVPLGIATDQNIVLTR